MSSSSGHILVVDDSHAALQLLVGALREAGYNVRAADSGALAVASIRVEPPDLILLDVQLGDMSGFDVLAEVRADERTAAIPVIMVTAHADTEALVHGLDAGAVDFLGKPYQRAELLARVRTHTELSWARRQLAAQAQQLQELVTRLRKSEARFRLMVENVGDIVFHSVDGITEWVSPSIQVVAGWAPEDLIGATTTHLWHPDDLAKAVALRDSTYAGRGGREVLRYRRKSGDYVWLEVVLQPFPEPDGRTGAVGIMRDVSDRVAADAALAESRAQYQLLAENATDVVFSINTAGEVTFASDGAARTLGWTPDELRGRAAVDFVHPDDLAMLRAQCEDPDAGMIGPVRFRMPTAAGDYIWVEATARKVRDEHGTVGSHVGGLHDVTAEVAAQAALERQARTDALTGLLNRAQVICELQTVLAHPARSDRRIGVAFCDLDGLKRVNDLHGHAAGDLLVATTARRIRAAVRAEDLVARVGGDELLVILTGVRSLADAAAVAEKIRRAVTEPIPITARRLELATSVSIGVTMALPGEEVDAPIARADAAMYRAKHRGGNAISCEPADGEGVTVLARAN